jgi:hypothetical protein
VEDGMPLGPARRRQGAATIRWEVVSVRGFAVLLMSFDLPSLPPTLCHLLAGVPPAVMFPLLLLLLLCLIILTYSVCSRPFYSPFLSSTHSAFSATSSARPTTR